MAQKTGNGRTFRGVSGRTENQKKFIFAVNSHDIIFLLSPWGTGKTFLSIGLGCEFLVANKIEKIVFVRSSNHIIKDYGYSPGDYKMKSLEFFNQHIEYFEKFLGRNEFQKLWNDNIIELTSTSIIRGRNFENAMVILDEAQHSSKEDVILFLSRLSKGSKAIIMGDVEQNGGNNCFFGRMFQELEDEAVAKVEMGPEDIMRHSATHRICMKIKNI